MPVVQHVPAFDEHLGPFTMYSPGLLDGVNGPPTGPVYPALAVQAATAVLATGEFEFDGHVEHAPGPVDALNCPATQAVAALPSDPVYPALAMHKIGKALPVGEVVPSGHPMHEAADEPGFSLYVASGQGVTLFPAPLYPALAIHKSILVLAV